MEIDITEMKLSPNAKEDSWNMIKSEPPDKKHVLKEEPNHVENSSKKGNSDLPKNTLKIPIIILTKLHWCNKCRKKFKTAKSLRAHKKDHDLRESSVFYPIGSTTRRYTCPTCKRVYTKFVRLKAHVLRHNSDDPYECKVCKKTFSVKRYLINHMSCHKNRSSYVCDICFRGFTYKISLNEHLREHMDVRPRNCEICGKGFICNASRDTHIHTHNEEKRFECDMCKKRFTTYSTMKFHILGNMESSRRYKCPSCVKGFSTTKGLEAHIQTICLDKTCEYDVLRTKRITSTTLFHQGRKECQIVGSKLPNQSGDPYFCESCSLFFLKKAYFDAHQNLHSIKNPHVCNICGNIFVNKYSLQLHQSSLTEETPYFECDICKLKWCHKTTLLSHRKTHFYNAPPKINEVHEMVFQENTFKSAPLKTYERKKIPGSIKNGINLHPTNFQRIDLKTYARNEIVSFVKTEPDSEIQNKEDRNLVPDKRRIEKFPEIEKPILLYVKEEPRDPLDLTESEDSILFPSVKKESFDPSDSNNEAEACDVKVEFEEFY